METPDKPTPPISGWNHLPDLPIQASPFFAWPPDPRAMWRWLAVRWLGLAENVIVLAFALVAWVWFQPAPDVAATLAPGWIFGLWVKNFVLISLVAGGLHVFFYSRKLQGDRLKYDPRDLMVKGRQFTFGGQVRDNMFWTLSSGVGVWTAYEVLMFWAMANGYAPVLLFADNPIWFIALLLLTPVWISFHFYWIHRALHWGPLYKMAHSLHHRNINVGPWSGISMHPIEHIMFFSSILIHFIVPAHPIHILFHMQHQALTGASSHTGYEAFLVKDKKHLSLGTFHHQLHHRYFEVNYGNLDVPWDKWFGSFHDGTAAGQDMMKARRKKFGR